MKPRKLVGYKTLKRFVKKQIDGSISKDAIEFLQTSIEQKLKEVCQTAVQQLEEQNQFRKFHHQPKKRRFDSSIFKKLSIKVLKDSYVNSYEEHGEMNRNTCFSKAETGEIE